MKQNIQIGLFIFAGIILLPVAVRAQEAYDRVLEQGRQDCQKIANQVGEENPSVFANVVGSDDFFVTCGWDHFGYWRGYTSQMIEDVKIITNAIHLNRYISEEAAKNDLKNIIAVYSENTVGGLITETKKTTDGFVYISKIDWVALSGDPTAAKSTNNSSVIVGIARGNCLVSVSGDTMREPNVYKQYHYIDPKTYKYVDRHPDFNHDREAELLLLARAKAEEILGVLDCGEGTPSTTLPVENVSGPSPYAACAIKCLDDVDARYQCPLPSPSVDDSGVSVIVLPDGSTRNFSPWDNTCVDDRGKTQNACLFQCQATVGGGPISDPMADGQPIKVAGTASDDPLNEAGKYINLLKRKPELPSTEENLKKILDNYEAGKPMSVWDVKGEPEMQVPGSDEWVVLKKGDAIPPGARIFTGMDDDLFVSLPGVYLVKVRSFTDITFNQTGISKALSKKELINHLDLRTGDVEVHVEKGTYQGTMQVRMPQAVVGVRGTHFWVSYDETKRLGAVGVYEGEVTVDDLFRGTRTLLTPANDKTPRVMVIPSTDSASVQGQDTGAATPRPQAPEGSNSGVWWLVFALMLGGGVFILHKTGKLQPIFQKVSRLVRRNDPIQP